MNRFKLVCNGSEYDIKSYIIEFSENPKLNFTFELIQDLKAIMGIHPDEELISIFDLELRSTDSQELSEEEKIFLSELFSFTLPERTS